MNLQTLAEERSLEYHRVIASRLADHPEILVAARTWIHQQRSRSSRSQAYLDRWAEILALPTPHIQQALLDPGEEARALRQCSPFAGLIAARERWQIWREVRERFEAKP